MASLSTNLRNQLERAIVAAREAAETGARVALESLAVDHGEPYRHLGSAQRALRNQLRARARQLGDRKQPRPDANGKDHGIEHLAGECAYEYWHRMIFARFLAENNLLIDSRARIAISLAEAEELAQQQGMNVWVFASRCAEGMLPQIFRPDDPLLLVSFAPEHQLKLEALLEALPSAVFTAADALGWVYQFWQSKKKDQVNASGVKIGADEISAVTQLFTEPYMVEFLLHNTIGAWWAGKVMAGNAELAALAGDEEALRKAVALSAGGGYRFDYLRFERRSGILPLGSGGDDGGTRQDAASTIASAGQSRSGILPLNGGGDGGGEGTRLEAASTDVAGPVIGYFDPHAGVVDMDGNLPHWRQDGVTYFVTFRTADSMPQEKLQQWERERAAWLSVHPEPHDEATKAEYFEQFPARFQSWLDAGYGACRLALPACKEIVEKALRHFNGQRYDLDEYVVMPNHVHALVTPKPGHDLSDILHSWKSFTANEINKALGERGAFWQKESFDHIVRGAGQLARIREYIRENPGARSRSGILPLVDGGDDGGTRQDAASTSASAGQGRSGILPLVDGGGGGGDGGKRLEAASTGAAGVGASKAVEMGEWVPAAGVFDGWPGAAAELKILDPCCGSGHFLVAAFECMVPLRMAEEALTLPQAIDAVLRDNLYGLEIDERCCQIAAFALALAAWKVGGWRPLPPMNIACTGIGPQCSAEEWLELAEESGLPMPAAGREFIKQGLLNLHQLFSQAATLGSLIDPTQLPGHLIAADFETIQPYLKAIMAAEQGDNDLHERAIAAAGMVKAADILAGQYTLVITNVPYLGRGRQNAALKSHLERHFAEGKSDLATAFVQRSLELCTTGGTTALVTPQNWLFLTSYSKLRKRLLVERQWNMVARLGPGAFETIGGHVVNVSLLAISAHAPAENHTMAGMDVSSPRGQRPIRAAEKALLLRGEGGAEITFVEQAGQLGNPDARVVLGGGEEQPILGCHANSMRGVVTGDSDFWIRALWEVPNLGGRWRMVQSCSDRSCHYAGRSRLINWSTGGRGMLRPGIANFSLGLLGVVVNLMHELGWTIYTGELYDNNCGTVVPCEPSKLLPIVAFCSSARFRELVRKIDQKLNVTNATLVKVPFDLAYWEKVAAEKYPNGLPEPESDDPTQWLFHGWPDIHAAGESRSRSGILPLGGGGDGVDGGTRQDAASTSACTGDGRSGILPLGGAGGGDGGVDGGTRQDAASTEASTEVCTEASTEACTGDGRSGILPLGGGGDGGGTRQDAASTEACTEVCTGDGRSGILPLVCGGGGGGTRQDAASTEVSTEASTSVSTDASGASTGVATGGIILQVAVARLLGYRWPAELDETMRLSQRARELVKRCAELLKFADDDGIVCIPALRGEEPAADRLRALLLASGIAPEKLRELAGGVDLDDYLRESFFEQHCRIFHDRPFIWHIWDGRKRDGFQALVNYHKLCAPDGQGRKLLESLTYSYLGDWITRQQAGVVREEGGAEDRVAAAVELQQRLAAILEGHEPYDIFVRWKPLSRQPIGWDPDINDGVRLNSRPFLAADLSNGRKGAGVLRCKPNIKWGKDRGKEPRRKKEEFPWFWGWDEQAVDFMGGKEFDGNRWNDCHYSHEAKQAARVAAGVESARHQERTSQ